MAEQNNNEIINDFDILNPFAIHSFLYFLFLYYRLHVNIQITFFAWYFICHDMWQNV